MAAAVAVASGWALENERRARRTNLRHCAAVAAARRRGFVRGDVTRGARLTPCLHTKLIASCWYPEGFMKKEKKIHLRHVSGCVWWNASAPIMHLGLEAFRVYVTPLPRHQLPGRRCREDSCASKEVERAWRIREVTNGGPEGEKVNSLRGRGGRRQIVSSNTCLFCGSRLCRTPPCKIWPR